MVKYEDADLDRIFAALGDPTRRAILQRLQLGDASVSQLAAPLAMSLAGAAKHVEVLAEAGLIEHEKLGRVRTCRLQPDALRVAAQMLREYRGLWRDGLDRLESDLRRLEKEESSE